MPLIQPVKGVPLNQSFVRILNGKHHLFIENSSGSMVHIWPERGINRVIVNRSTNLEYFYTGYSHVTNCVYLWNQNGYTLVEYNVETGKTDEFEMNRVGNVPYSFQGQFHARYPSLPYIPMLSTDGHVYIGLYLSGNLYGYMRFNVITKQFDQHSCIPDKEFFHIYMRRDCDARYIIHPSLGGVYSRYIWSTSGGGYVHLRDTILSEMASAGIAFTDTGNIWIHQSDRALSSSTRRVWINTPAGSRILDIKAPSVWINSPSHTDQTNTPLDTTGWISGVKLYSLAAQAGLTVPTLDISLSYPSVRRVGRFVYVGYNYLGNKTHFYTFAIHPLTGQALYPGTTFNKYNDFLNNGAGVTYKCNFGGLFGYSNGEELVEFLKGHGNSGWYFLRADNYEFEAYNPTLNPNGYVIRAVNLNSTTDPDGLHTYHTPRFTNSVIQTIAGEDYYVDNNYGCKPALSTEFKQDNVGSFSTVTYKVLPDKNKPDEKFEYEVKGLFANPFDVIAAITIRDNKVICVGETYSGASCINVVDGDTFTLQKYLSDFISPNGAIKVDENHVFVYGYSGLSHLIDATDWDNIKKYDIPTGDTNEVMYVTIRPEGIFVAGIPSRSSGFHEGCSFSLADKTTKTQVSLNNRFPNEFNFKSAVSLRIAAGLDGATYPDNLVETAIQNYMTSTGQSRATVINAFLNTCRWSIADLYTDGNKTYVGLRYRGVLGLNGIRIEQTPGSGTWITKDQYQSGGGKALLIETSNVLNVQPNEIKAVEFRLSPNVQSMGRIAMGTTRLAFIVNDLGASRGLIRVVTKVAFDAAANGPGFLTSLERTIDVGFGTSNNEYGWGAASDFDHHSTHKSNAYVCVGDMLYITCKSNVSEGSGQFPCVLKINLATGAVETFAKSATVIIRCISVEGDTMLITNGANVVEVEDFQDQIGAIVLS